MNYYFLGVTTGQSAMKRIMPNWGELLGIDLNFVGVDMPIDAEPRDYIEFAERMKNDPQAVGAVVTTHKLNLYRHAGHVFDECDEIARLTGEIGSIARRDGRLIGLAAVDLMSFSLAVKAITESSSWDAQGADVVCFGAGGAARSVLISLFYDVLKDKSLRALKTRYPASFTVIDNQVAQLDSYRRFLDKLALDNTLRGSVHLVESVDVTTNDKIVAECRSSSLIVNATGLGKDRPGSPTSASVVFPEGARIWDLNYRGQLRFLDQANAQLKDRKLFVFDGWVCFLHGWTQSIEQATGIDMAPKFKALEQSAARLR